MRLFVLLMSEIQTKEGTTRCRAIKPSFTVADSSTPAEFRFAFRHGHAIGMLTDELFEAAQLLTKRAYLRATMGSFRNSNTDVVKPSNHRVLQILHHTMVDLRFDTIIREGCKRSGTKARESKDKRRLAKVRDEASEAQSAMSGGAAGMGAAMAKRSRLQRTNELGLLVKVAAVAERAAARADDIIATGASSSSVKKATSPIHIISVDSIDFVSSSREETSLDTPSVSMYLSRGGSLEFRGASESSDDASHRAGYRSKAVHVLRISLVAVKRGLASSSAGASAAPTRRRRRLYELVVDLKTGLTPIVPSPSGTWKQLATSEDRGVLSQGTARSSVTRIVVVGMLDDLQQVFDALSSCHDALVRQRGDDADESKEGSDDDSSGADEPLFASTTTSLSDSDPPSTLTHASNQELKSAMRVATVGRLALAAKEGSTLDIVVAAFNFIDHECDRALEGTGVVVRPCMHCGRMLVSVNDPTNDDGTAWKVLPDQFMGDAAQSTITSDVGGARAALSSALVHDRCDVRKAGNSSSASSASSASKTAAGGGAASAASMSVRLTALRDMVALQGGYEAAAAKERSAADASVDAREMEKGTRRRKATGAKILRCTLHDRYKTKHCARCKLAAVARINVIALKIFEATTRLSYNAASTAGATIGALRKEAQDLVSTQGTVTRLGLPRVLEAQDEWIRLRSKVDGAIAALALLHK